MPGVFLQFGIERKFTLVTSNPLLSELREKLVTKFGVAEHDANAVRLKIEAVAEMVTPDFTLQVIATDPDDNRVLECAVAGNADRIVSGDRPLEPGAARHG